MSSPVNLLEALKQILYNPNLLALYTVTFIAALLLPLMITLAHRKWHQFKLRQEKVKHSAEQDEFDSIELPNGMTGSFNKSMLESIQETLENSMSNIKPIDAGCPFISRQNLSLIEKEVKIDGGQLSDEGKNEEEKIDTDEFSMLLSDEIQGEKKKPRKRKQFKDPDPETADALNKLIEKGLHGKLATAQLRAKTHLIEESMSEEERRKEQQIQQEQLAKIFEMMETQKEKFGIDEKADLVEQMKLYSI